MEQVQYSREELQELLRQRIVQITFTKTDGTERVMNCTLQAHLLPPIVVDPTKPPKAERKINDEVLPVFDVDKSQWRSFRLDSIISVV